MYVIYVSAFARNTYMHLLHRVKYLKNIRLIAIKQFRKSLDLFIFDIIKKYMLIHDVYVNDAIW